MDGFFICDVDTYRRPLRLIIWKQLKHIRTKFTNLIKLGMKKPKAWEWSNTRKR